MNFCGCVGHNDYISLDAHCCVLFSSNSVSFSVRVSGVCKACSARGPITVGGPDEPCVAKRGRGPSGT